MNNVRITLLVPPERERAIEDALKQVEINAMVCVKSRGHGGRPNFYAKDWTNEIVLFELFVSKQQLPLLKEQIKSICDNKGKADCIFVTSEVSELFPSACDDQGVA